MKAKVKKPTITSLRKELKEANKKIENLMSLNESYRHHINEKDKELVKAKNDYNELKNRKHIAEVGQILQTLANINEAVSKTVLSINGHL